jgi:hypothetical protein
MVFVFMKKKFDSIDEYIATFPKNVQDVLQQARNAIRDAAPKAERQLVITCQRSN